ncbi:MAG TPA: diaminopropionate ammonia-lyase [Firmicutes bacterium]|nr:diaminopropionate ammonia-lyase [Candidatus Fermentithermobacillaceae bacterium]
MDIFKTGADVQAVISNTQNGNLKQGSNDGVESNAGCSQEAAHQHTQPGLFAAGVFGMPHGVSQGETGLRAVIPKALREYECPPFLTCQASAASRGFHSTLPGYRPTPLVKLKSLARELGVGEIHVKDESSRFGLNAFKGLGGSYAIARAICEKAGLDADCVRYEDLISEEARGRAGLLTFATATAGNHGKGVAWAAGLLGHKSVVYVPRGTADSRAKAIESLGARVVVSPFNYDDTVRHCVRDAQSNGWVLIQDTAWEGYTQIPKWVMQGYTTIVSELREQLAVEAAMSAPAQPPTPTQKQVRAEAYVQEAGDETGVPGPQSPTHIFLQAGVGGMAAAVLGCYADCVGKDYPVSVIVEPDRAACMLVSAARADGKAHSAFEDERGDLRTMMAGLACGEPNPLAWEVLRDLASAYIACSDKVSARGMQVLGSPLGDDPVVVSGESGAVGIGLLWIICKSPWYSGLRRKLQLNENSVIVFVSTEGDTDPVNYRRIMDGE